jgi:ABC-type phosphate/phosphonate transport system substrate-binding protein
MPTPRSTPLPPVATVVAPGSEESPLRMFLVPADAARLSEADADGLDAAARFANAVQQESGLVLEVVPVDTPAEALSALCAAAPGQVAVAWLDGVAYRAAMARGCGVPELQVERGSPQPQAGMPVVIVADRSLGLSGVGPLAGRTFCRLNVDDVESWLAPALALRAAGIDPVADLGAVLDFDDYDALLAAVAAGDCAAAGLTEARFDGLSDAVRDELSVVGRTPPLPFALLLYPISLPLGERLRLTDALLALAFDAERSDLMQPLLAQDGVARVGPDDLNTVDAFLDSTGLDFAQLGD